jgi:hypothetical protein
MTGCYCLQQIGSLIGWLSLIDSDGENKKRANSRDTSKRRHGNTKESCCLDKSQECQAHCVRVLQGQSRGREDLRDLYIN